MSPQGIFPRLEFPPTCYTLDLLVAGAFDVSSALPLPSEVSVAYAAAPLPSDVVKRGNALATTWLRCAGWFRRCLMGLRGG